MARRALKRKRPVEVAWKSRRFLIRPTDSDLFVASQVFGHQEYDIGSDVRDRLRRLATEWRAQNVTPIIVDAGANVGYSAVYFADCFPGAVILAIEPDYSTFEMLKHNCHDMRDIVPVHAALWSHEEGVSLTQSSDSGSWANTVHDGGTVPSVKLERLIEGVNNGRPLIVKLDIEGAEREVCESSAAVFQIAPVIIVEPHDFMLPGAGCLAPLYRALASRRMDTLIIGENLVFADSHLLHGKPSKAH